MSAERAWEADELDVVHFSGAFVLRAPDWSLEGDTAVVYGKLDDPDKVVVEGKPAKISFLRQEDETTATDSSAERIDGSASVVQYFRATDKLTMSGTATLTRKDSTLASDSIEYDVETDRYSASGAAGINIILNTDD
ncbi:MAG: LptA/OstA family protein [Halieaceae bacterium]